MDRVLARFFAAAFLFTLAVALATPLLPALLRLDFAASVGLVGGVMAIHGVLQIALRLPMGDMADRRGRRPSLVLAFAVMAAAGVAFALAPSVLVVAMGVALFGFAGGVFWVAANSYLFDRAEGAMARATSDYAAAIGAAFVVGPPAGGLVAATWGFPAAFALVVASALAGLGLVLTLPEVPPAPRPRAATGPYRRAWRLLARRPLAVSALATFLYSCLFSTMLAFFPLVVLDAGHSLAVAGLVLGPVALVGALVGARQVAATAVRVGLPRALDRVGPANVLVGGVVAGALATAALPLATSLGALALLVVAFGAATGVMIPANLMLVHAGAPVDERGLANGIYGTMLGVGGAVAPAALGLLARAFGTWSAFVAAGAVGLAGAAALVALARARDAAE